MDRQRAWLCAVIIRGCGRRARLQTEHDLKGDVDGAGSKGKLGPLKIINGCGWETDTEHLQRTDNKSPQSKLVKKRGKSWCAKEINANLS